ncbi:MAG: hypothetical protein IKF48_07110 [Oscillospiraceae bacterium]|nr:hypothetical protein [Oscillospiraceae bacterium]
MEYQAGQSVGVKMPQRKIHNARQSRSFQGFAGFSKAKKWFATSFESAESGWKPIPQMPMISDFLTGSASRGRIRKSFSSYFPLSVVVVCVAKNGR